MVAVTPTPPLSCVFEFGDDVTVDLFVAVDDGEGRMTSPAVMLPEYRARTNDGDAVAIEGVGAEAVYDRQFRAIVVDAGGDRVFSMGVNGGYDELAEPQDALVELAGLAAGRM